MQAFYLPNQRQQTELNSRMFFFGFVYSLVFINYLFLEEKNFIGEKG